MGPTVRMERVHAGYHRWGRRVPTLNDVSMRAGPGTITAVTGPNGAGKSTLLGLLLGQGRPWAGFVRVGGQTPRRYRRRHGLGFLPEASRLPRGWTVGGLLRHCAALRGLERHEAETIAHRLGLACVTDRAAARLSKGTRRRVGLAWAFLGSPDLILLDEPSSGLDPDGRAILVGLLGEARERGQTVLMASHDPALVRVAASRTLVLGAGRATYGIGPEADAA